MTLRSEERTEALAAVRRASTRSAAVVHREMKRGLGSLATIASIAPWIGMCGTLLGMHNSFGSVNSSREAIMALYFAGLSQALAPCALGLVVALTAKWCYSYLLNEGEELDSEANNVTLQL